MAGTRPCRWPAAATLTRIPCCGRLHGVLPGDQAVEVRKEDVRFPPTLAMSVATDDDASTRIPSSGSSASMKSEAVDGFVSQKLVSRRFR
jgi:hypothetical protein